MICVAILVIELSATELRTTDVHRQIVCVKEQVRLVNFLADRRKLINELEEKSRALEKVRNITRVRNMKIKGNG